LCAQTLTLSVHPGTDRSVRALDGERLATLPKEFTDKVCAS
jgi:hypothetical protein